MNNPLFTVARFEIKTLLRSWFFRIFSAIVIGFILFFNIIAATEIGRTGWSDRMLIGGLPYMNLWVLNIVQAIIAVFLSADFLSRDRKLDTTEVIYVRNMSNFQYVFGKTLGILTVFGGLNLVVLVFTFVINLISPDAGFSLITYLLYPFIISFPTLVFVLGLSFLVMQLVKNQAITFILVLGYIATAVFYLKGKHFGIWDFITFNTPLAFSSYVGFININQLIFLRGGYFLIGLSLVFFTVYKLPRLPQTKFKRRFILFPAIIFLGLALGGISYYLFDELKREDQLRQLAIFEKQLPINAGYEIGDYQIKLDHDRNQLKGIIDFTVLSSDNKGLPKRLKFFFNNGYKVNKVILNKKAVKFEHNLSILSVEKGTNSGDSIKMRLSFEGIPLDNLSYFELNSKERELLHRYDPLLAGKKSCFVNPNYLLLTKESFWYPVVAERNAFRVQKFFNYRLKIKSTKKLNFLSQGIKSEEDEWICFNGDRPYSKISLVGGGYQKKSIEVDSVDYGLFLDEDNNYFDDYFNNLSDTLPNLIKEIKKDYERKLGIRYPYKRLTFVEVPLHFYAYFRGWSICNDNTQPEMVFVPERGAGIFDFNLAFHINREERRVKRENLELLPKEIETNVFMNMVGNTFAQPVRGRGFFRGDNNLGRTLDNWSAYSLFPLYYNYVYSLAEQDLPFMNMCLESYMLNRVHNTENRFGRLNSTDKSILYLNKNSKSLKELVDIEDLEINVADLMITVGSNQFAIAQSKVGIDDFGSYIDSLLKTNKFKLLDNNNLGNLLKDEELEVSSISTSSNLKLPSFIFGKSLMYEFTDDNRKKYFVSIEIANVGETDGVIKASLMGGGRGNRAGRGGRGGNRERRRGGDRKPGRMSAAFEETYFIEKGEHVRIGIVLNNAPRMLNVHTFLSKNLPSDARFPLADFEKAPNNFKAFVGKYKLDKKITLIEKNEVVVDNENEGFSVVNISGRKTLKEIIRASRDNDNKENGSEYKTLSFFRPAPRWTPVLNSMAFGEFTKSFSYKKAGEGNAKAQFKANLVETGRYNVYAMIPSQRIGNFRNQDPEDATYIFTVYHDDGEEEVEVAVDKDAASWVLLGEYYFSDGEAVVELSDKTAKNVVVADAVKWVKL